MSNSHKPVTRIDRVVYPVFAVALGSAALAFLPAVVLGVIGYGGMMFPAIAGWLLIPYVLVDLCSLYMGVTRVIRGGGGPSGVGGISLGYYAVFSLAGLEAAWWWRASVFGLLFLFHAFCHYLVPRGVARRISQAGQGK